MPKKCCIENCRLQADSPGCHRALSFFRAPKNPKRRAKWEKSINEYFKSEKVLGDYTYVCALHFTDECFNNSGMGQRVTLKNTAVPTLFINYSSQNSLQNASSVNNVVDENATELQTQSISHQKSSDQPVLYFLDLDSNEILKMDVNTTQTYVSILNCQNLQGHFEEQSVSKYELSPKDMKSDCHMQSSESEKFFRKSIVSIDLNKINLNNNVLVLRLLKNAQKEVSELRKSCRAKTSKLYRCKKRIKNINSLLSRLKKQGLIKEKELKTLDVGDD